VPVSVPANESPAAQTLAESNAGLCRRNGWVAGDLLCCGEPVPSDGLKFVRITAVGDVEVLGRRVNGDCSEGPETLLSLLPHECRRLTLREWQSLQDTAPS
jgi:hypothetical protein